MACAVAGFGGCAALLPHPTLRRRTAQLVDPSDVVMSASDWCSSAHHQPIPCIATEASGPRVERLAVAAVPNLETIRAAATRRRRLAIAYAGEATSSPGKFGEQLRRRIRPKGIARSTSAISRIHDITVSASARRSEMQTPPDSSVHDRSGDALSDHVRRRSHHRAACTQLRRHYHAATSNAEHHTDAIAV